MAQISVTGITDYGAFFELVNLDTSWRSGTRYLWWFIKSGNTIATETNFDKSLTNGGQGYPIEDGVSQSDIYGVTGLEPDQLYSVTCIVYDEDMEWINEIYATFTTLPYEDEDPTWVSTETDVGTIGGAYKDSFYSPRYTLHRYKVTFKKSGTATFYTEGNKDTVGYLTTTSVYDSDGEPYPYSTILESDDDSGTGLNFKITYDVSSYTTYYLWVRCLEGTDSGDIDLYIKPPKPKKWSWTSRNNLASATSTSNAYNAVVNKTAVENFSHLVWNDMVDKAKEITDYAVGWWDGSYASYSDTKFSTTPYELTAEMFNSLRNNIDNAGYNYIKLGYKTGIGKVDSGDIVFGDYFLTLAEYINECIDNL